MRIFTHEDCDQTGFGFSLKNKVVVLPQSVLPEDRSVALSFSISTSVQQSDT